MVELALTLPLLIALSMAATDFGRLFYHGVTIANAAGAGAFYGARDKVLSGAFEKHMDHAKEDMTNSGYPLYSSDESSYPWTRAVGGEDRVC